MTLTIVRGDHPGLGTHKTHKQTHTCAASRTLASAAMRHASCVNGLLLLQPEYVAKVDTMAGHVVLVRNGRPNGSDSRIAA